MVGSVMVIMTVAAAADDDVEMLSPPPLLGNSQLSGSAPTLTKRTRNECGPNVARRCGNTRLLNREAKLKA